MKTVLFILGTRPEAIKLAPVITEMRRTGQLRAEVCATAQHRELMDEVLELFEIRPDYDLNLMRTGQTLTEFTARLFEGLGRQFEKARPDCVVVQGDTTTVLVGAIAAFYHQIPVAHVEAGLRTGNLAAPFPEEANRRMATVVSRWHFAPTAMARQNLLAEGVAADTIHVTGNTVIDAMNLVLDRARVPHEVEKLVHGRRFILVTMHRRESFGAGLADFCAALSQLARSHPEFSIVYPVHPNPNVSGPVHHLLGSQPNIHLILPAGYLEFVGLMKACDFIITDSGGVQEEAPSLGKPVLVTRTTTERPEAVEAGSARLVGTETASIVSAAEQLITNPAEYQRMISGGNPYGSGNASSQIVSVLANEIPGSA